MSKGSSLIAGLVVGIIIGGGGGYYLGFSQNGKKSNGDMGVSKSVQNIPSLDEASRLVSESMELFANSLHQKSMKNFYENISDFWKKKTSPEKLDKAFQPFIKAKIDLRPLKKVKPVLVRKPGLTKNGDLVVEGFYPTRPNRVLFRQIYRLENGKWKLSAFVVRLQKVKQPKKQK